MDLSAFPTRALLRWDLAVRLFLSLAIPLGVGVALGDAGQVSIAATMAAALVSFGTIGPDNYAKYLERGFPFCWVFVDESDDAATAPVIEAVKTAFKPATPQREIDALIVRHALKGRRVVRLKSGDPGVFGRLDEEIAACEAAGVAFAVVPGITAASAAAASLGQSLTRRGRNSELRVLTGHDVAGFADHDWRALARPGAVAAIYMGLRAARFVQGRLLMHGADPSSPVTVVENAGRPGERAVASSLAALASDIEAAGLGGPAVILLGLAPRGAAEAQTPAREAAR